MNISLPNNLKLFGVYSDPMRDARRHTTSVVYVVTLPENIVPRAGDDAKSVQRVSISEAAMLDFFADHKTIINDFVNGIIGEKNEEKFKVEMQGNIKSLKRSICIS